MNEQKKIRNGIRAVRLVFIINGFITFAVPPRFAEIAADLGLDGRALGIALAGETVGLAAAGLLLALWLARYFGSRNSFGISLILFCLGPATVAASHSFGALLGSQVYQGVFNAPVDLAGITMALALSARAGKKLLPKFEAGFTIGGLVGSAFGAVAAGRLGVGTFLVIVAAIATACGLAAWRFLPEERPEQRGNAGRKPTRREEVRIWAIAILAFLGLLCQFLAQTWASVFYRTELHATPGQYGYGGFAFTAGFLAAQFSGTRLDERFGTVAVIRCSGLVFGAAMGVLAISNSVALATAALAIAGLGGGNIVPLATSSVDAHPRWNLRVAWVTTVMYFGAGAARLFGILADATSQRWMMGTGVLIGILVVLMAAVARDPRPGGEAEEAL